MDPVVTSTLLKVGGSILSGLFGKKKTKTSTDFAGLVKDAQAAGFNPLTALQATGGAGNTITTGGGMSAGEFLSEALNIGADYFDKTNPINIRRNELELELMEAELERIQKTSGSPVGFGEVPMISSQPQSPVRSNAGGAMVFDPMDPAQLRVGGSDLNRNMDWSDAETIEARYGDVASWAYGLATVAADVGHNLGKKIGPALGNWAFDIEYNRALRDSYLEQHESLPRRGTGRAFTGGSNPAWLFN